MPRANLDKRRNVSIYVTPNEHQRLRGVAEQLGLVVSGKGSLSKLAQWLASNRDYVFSEHCRIPYLLEGEFFCASGECRDAAQIPRSCNVKASIQQCARHCKRKEPCPCREPASSERMARYRAWIKRKNG